MRLNILQLLACSRCPNDFRLQYISTAQEYSHRDITRAVVWGAGGGTDSINRMNMVRDISKKFRGVGN